jgi:hypothetical protein
LYNTVFKSAQNRLPLKGASEFYNQLHLGKRKTKSNPIFYVSHSPWNLYRYLDLFLSEIVYFFHLFLIGYSIYNFFKNKRIKYFFSLVALLLITGLYFPIQYYYDQDAIDKFAERQKLEQTNPTNGD